MCSNCAFRSGLWLPSRVLRFTCRRYFSRPSSFGILLSRSCGPSRAKPPPASRGFSIPTSAAASDRPSSRVPPIGAGLPAELGPFRSGSDRRRRAGEPRRTTPRGGQVLQPRPIVLRAIPVARTPRRSRRAGCFGLRRREKAARPFIQVPATAANRSRITDVSIIARLYEGTARAGISLAKNPGGVTSLNSIDFGPRLSTISQTDNGRPYYIPTTLVL